jgi:hypothetical protein
MDGQKKDLNTTPVNNPNATKIATAIATATSG